MTDGLPFLPGNTYKDLTKSQFHRAQTLGYRNGYAMKTSPTFGVGGDPILYNQLSEAELAELAAYNPVLTYGQVKDQPTPAFVPAFVSLDKKILKFEAELLGTVHAPVGSDEGPINVDLLYHLVDDTILVVNKSTNSSLPKGKLLNRQRMPKDDNGGMYSWKDLNLGTVITLYGRVYHICDCDAWTREWLESEGVLVNDPIPQQNGASSAQQLTGQQHTGQQLMAQQRTGQQLSKHARDEKLRKFLELDGQVLRFYCVWDDRDEMFGDLRKFILHYYLVNDTLEIREVHQPNDGRDPFPILIARQRVPVDRYDVQPSYPRTVLELTDHEIKRYFAPGDLAIGRTVQIYNRRFLLYDCDEFTKSYYRKKYGVTDFTPVALESRVANRNKGCAAENGQEDDLEGSGGDKTIHSCRSLIIKRNNNNTVSIRPEEQSLVLRYEAILDSTKPNDLGRRFILSYTLSDATLSVYEPPVKNSGIIGGRFLEKSKVARPGCPPDAPQFYSPQDFYLGAVIEVYRHRFIITDADQLVINYMKNHSEMFTEDSIERLSDLTHKKTSALKSTITSAPRTVDELESIIEQVRSQLKRLDVTGHTRKDQVFLGIEMNRAGYISKKNIKDMCVRQQLPSDDWIVEGLAARMGRDPDKITLEELREFLESP